MNDGGYVGQGTNTIASALVIGSGALRPPALCANGV